MQQKIDSANNIITTALDTFKFPFVSFSGGKDSLVVLYLTRQQEPNISVMFNETTDTPTETLEYINYLTKKWNLNISVTYPRQYTLKSLVQKYGFVAFRKRYCTYYLKLEPTAQFIRKRGFKLSDAAVITGMRKEEGKSRKNTQPFQKGKRFGYNQTNPLFDWKKDDVLTFISCNKLPLNPVYEKKSRCGCVHCFDYNWTCALLEEVHQDAA